VAKECGVNRISINPQTLNDKVLAYIGRAHTTEDFYRAFHIARQSGIPYINTDLIAGLPGDSFDGFSQTVDAIMQLAPENITVHTFCVKKAADIVRSESTIYSRTGGDTGKSVDYSQLQASFHGYIPYYIYRQKNAVGNLENVGFSQKGAEGLYNIFMMEEIHSIFGCGAGAVTKLVAQEGGRIERIFMPKYPYEYLAMEADVQIERQRKIADFYTASQTV
jgi:oxygen-independent coproporphyrinogen-3 oxidase